MSLKIIYGRAGAGKSYALFDDLINKSIKNENEMFRIIVPEQISLDTQKRVMELHPNKGSFNIEVTGFSRLANEIIKEAGRGDIIFTDELSKLLVTRKVLEDKKDELKLYKSKVSMPGFSETVSKMISESGQYRLDLSKILEVSKERQVLSSKISDIMLIKDAFDNYLGSKNQTSEDMMLGASKLMEGSSAVASTHYYIDGFTGFTPLQMEMVGALIKYAKNVTVTVTISKDELTKKYSELDLFALSKKTIEDLKEKAILARENVLEEEVEEDNPIRIKDNEEICFIEKNIFKTKKVYDKDVENVKILECHNPQTEIKSVAAKIISLVKEEGYRYRDIAVICADLDGYAPAIENIFSKMDIPSFIDVKHSVANNPASDIIIAIMRVVMENYSFDSVIHFAKHAMIPGERSDYEKLENYVLKSGKRGASSYRQEWIKKYSYMEDDEIICVNRARAQILSLVEGFRKDFSKRGSLVSEKTEAIRNFLREIDANNKIEIYKNYFNEAKDARRFLEFSGILNVIETLLDRIDEILGDEKLSVKEFSDILITALSNLRQGVVPPGVDTVTVGDIERTRLSGEKKIIFFMGLNDGNVPKSSGDSGIINDKERKFLSECGIEMAPTAYKNSLKQRLYIYMIFARPKEKLYLSYSKQGFDQRAVQKSYVISDLALMMPKVVTERIGTDSLKAEDILSRYQAFLYVAGKVREAVENKDSEPYKVASAMSQDKRFRSILPVMIKAAYRERSDMTLSKEVASLVYENAHTVGITRVERFCECMFRQFLQNGLCLSEREKFEIAAYDQGNMQHEALQIFISKLKNGKKNYADISYEECDSLMSEIIEGVISDYENDAISRMSSSSFVKSQVKEVALSSARVVLDHIQRGKFTPEMLEERVKHGRIDRVDLYRDGKDIYVKIIDYKTGSKECDITNIIDGTQLQLMTYMKDVIDIVKDQEPGKRVIPAGAMYFHVYDAFAEEMPNESEEELRESIKKNYQASGIFNDSEKALLAIDKTIKDREIAPSIKITVNKSGISGQLLSTDMYNKLLDYVEDSVKTKTEKLLSGEIKINPIKSACDYCPYKSVCRFDPGSGDKNRMVDKVKIGDLPEILGD